MRAAIFVITVIGCVILALTILRWDAKNQRDMRDKGETE